MTRETAELCMDVLAQSQIQTVDLTGGAPELCPSFEYLVTESKRLGRHVMDRCNLTVLNLAKYEHLPQFFAQHEVEVVSSLPARTESATDEQRGDGVYAESIEAIRKLNKLGYGQPDSGLELVLVSNPVEAKLPGPQACMEALWKEELNAEHGIVFNRLIAITNMPVRRYLDWLRQTGQEESYMNLLRDSFNPSAACGLMCRTTLSVDWQGNLFDCDFNQMMDMGTAPGAPSHLSEMPTGGLAGRDVMTAEHCFGCTAGAGSSCGGATA
ncbi:UNVERIFIED_CONTAM: hypothetical protein GTU68_025511 [Idotea baltica]|nr:hypothetical protein [Idotea baltica]